MLDAKSNVFCSFDAVFRHLPVATVCELVVCQSISDVVGTYENRGKRI
jgi:hypothetical protein